MSNGNRDGNIQLIVVCVLVVVAVIGWFVIRRHDAEAVAQRDATSCWTATCRDAVLHSGREAYEQAAGGR